VGVRRELRNQLLAASNRKPPRLTKEFVHTVRKIEQHDVVSSGILSDDFPDKHQRQWMKHALITLEKATEAYMVEVLAESHC